MLSNLKVVELASVLAGPAVGMFFAELGAEVIKVENKRTDGDVTRKWKHPNEPTENTISAYYCSVNWHKKVIFLDLSLNEDRQKVYDLVKDADVVIANFKTGDDVKLGMDYQMLKQHNQTLIYGQIISFTPKSQRTAFDVVLQAESGFMYMNGNKSPDSEVVKMPVALIDILTAHQLKEGILLALLEREKTGKGSYITASLMKTAIASLANQATNWLMAKHIPQPMGTLHPNIAPYGEMFSTKDGKLLVLAIGNDKQFYRLCKTVEQDAWISDERFYNNAQRVKHRSELQHLLAPIFQQKDRKTWLELLLEHQVPVGAIRNMQEVFELPIAQEMLLYERMEEVETVRVKTVAFEFMKSP